MKGHAARRRLIALARLRTEVHRGRGDVALIRIRLSQAGHLMEDPGFEARLIEELELADSFERFEGAHSEARSRSRWGTAARLLYPARRRTREVV